MSRNEELHGIEDPNEYVRATTYRNGLRQNQVIPWYGRQRPAATDYDVYIDFVHETARIQRPDGQELVHPQGLKGVGPVRIALLLKILRYPGRYLFPYELGRMDPRYQSHYVKEAVIPTVACLRKCVFRENAKNAWFLRTTTPFSVAFNRAASYCLVERIDHDPEED